MGVAGVTQHWSLSEQTYLQNSISFSRNSSGYMGYEPDILDDLTQTEDFRLDKRSLKGATTLHHKFNAKHNMQIGVIYTHHEFDFYNHYLDNESDQFVTDQDMRGKADQYQGFASWKYRPWQDVSIVSGIHVQKVSLTDEASVEPRASIRWQFQSTQAFTAGFGIHGKMESLPNYFAIVRSADGSETMPNQSLGFSKARHYVLGYENKLTTNLFFKVEAYYQQLYNLPVENDLNSSYSLVNQMEGFTDRTLINEGTGKNIGVELTLERYFANDYYFLVTTSAYDSRYRALDGVERNTLFNGNYVANVLFGKEFKLNSRKNRNKVLGVSGKISSLGPRRFTPINAAESLSQDETVYFEDRAFSEKGGNVFIANLGITYRIDNKRLSQELKVDIQNVTNNSAEIAQYYDENDNKIESVNQLGLLPVIIYTIHF
jgi:hypothetical protein